MITFVFVHLFFICSNSCFSLPTSGLHTGLTLWSTIDGKTICQHLQVGKHTVPLFIHLSVYTSSASWGCIHLVAHLEIYSLKWRVSHQSPWYLVFELSSHSPVTHEPMTHSSSLAEPDFNRIFWSPTPFLLLAHWAGGWWEVLWDHLADF